MTHNDQFELDTRSSPNLPPAYMKDQAIGTPRATKTSFVDFSTTDTPDSPNHVYPRQKSVKIAPMERANDDGLSLRSISEEDLDLERGEVGKPVANSLRREAREDQGSRNLDWKTAL